MRNGSLWSNVLFEKEVISHSNDKRLAEPFIMHLKAHREMQQRCLFFYYSLANLMTNWDNFHRIVIHAYVGIHQWEYTCSKKPLLIVKNKPFDICFPFDIMCLCQKDVSCYAQNMTDECSCQKRFSDSVQLRFFLLTYSIRISGDITGLYLCHIALLYNNSKIKHKYSSSTNRFLCIYWV